MATYSITYSCGHNEEKLLYGKEEKRQKYIAWAESHGQCSDCYQANKGKALEAIEAEHNLPPLAGSEKQIAWARKIRAEKIVEVVKWMESHRERAQKTMNVEKYEQEVAAVLQALYQHTTAKWWIDGRDKFAPNLANEAFQETVK